MPYKDPERKRQLEREHREQRNAMRRAQRIVAQTRPTDANSAPDPSAKKKLTSGWKVLLGFAVGLGVVVLAATSGVKSAASR